MLTTLAGWSFAAILFITVIAIFYDVAVRMTTLYGSLRREMKLADQGKVSSGRLVKPRPPRSQVRQSYAPAERNTPRQRIAA